MRERKLQPCLRLPNAILVGPAVAAFCTYPDFAPWRDHLARSRGVATGADLARHLLDAYGMGVLPASVFGERDSALRLRVATGLLYGDTEEERQRALAAPDPLALPWITAALARLEHILADLAP
jgi:aspartate aminotransferase